MNRKTETHSIYLVAFDEYSKNYECMTQDENKNTSENYTFNWI